MSGTAKNFLKVLYEAIVPRRPQEAAPRPLAQPTENRQALSRLHVSADAGKYMTRQFNTYCSEAGVQCTVQMDPSDYRQIFIFQNLGDHLVKIEWGTEVRFIEPHEHTVVKVNASDMLDRNWNNIPRVTALNNGLNGD